VRYAAFECLQTGKPEFERALERGEEVLATAHSDRIDVTPISSTRAACIHAAASPGLLTSNSLPSPDLRRLTSSNAPSRTSRAP